MIWHIAKRELYDNMTSLRFALTTALLLVMMLVNAVNHLGDYPEEIRSYWRKTSGYLDALKSRSDSLWRLVHNGPGYLYRKPSPLTFCADGARDHLSFHAKGRPIWYSFGVKVKNEQDEIVDGSARAIWRLYYPQEHYHTVSPHLTKIDWAFMVGYVLSFVGILFTFDAISGERERGTLRLMMATSTSRNTVLLGKFLGALVSIGLPFLIAALLNLIPITDL